MRLGRETGSTVNMVMGNTRSPEPEVGMGVTFLCWTDRHPGTIVGVDRSGKRPLIAVQGDHAQRVDDNGMSESQTYEYSPNPDAPIGYYRLEDDGRWYRVVRNAETGRWNKRRERCIIGHREKYHDFSF